jgi:hypothetical protein
MAQRDPLLSPGPHKNPFSLQSAKARKSISSARGGGVFFVNAMLYMAPHKFAGVGNVCTSAFTCIEDCLWRSGQTLTKARGIARNAQVVEMVKRVGLDRAKLIAMVQSELRTPKGKRISEKSATDSVDGFLRRGGASPVNTVENARVKKTRRMMAALRGVEDPYGEAPFLEDIYYGIAQLVRAVPTWRRNPPAYLRKAGFRPGDPLEAVIRLNGTSDFSWENVLFKGKTFMAHFPSTQFYDYTKHYARVAGYAAGRIQWPGGGNLPHGTGERPWPKNYHLTFSMGGVNDIRIPEVLASGVCVAAVFKGNPPKRWNGDLAVRMPGGKNGVIKLDNWPVLPGDEDDLRFLDPKGHVVGLAYKATTGSADPSFVLDVPGDVERWLDAEIGKKVEVLHPSRRNPSEDDLLGEGPSAPYVPGGIPPMVVPHGASGNDPMATSRLGCGGYGTGPLRNV